MTAEALSTIFLSIIGALTPMLIAWLRLHTQKLIVQQAVLDVERNPQGLKGEAKRQRAKTLSGETLTLWTRPRDSRFDTLIDEALPSVREVVRRD